VILLKQSLIRAAKLSVIVAYCECDRMQGGLEVVLMSIKRHIRASLLGDLSPFISLVFVLAACSTPSLRIQSDFVPAKSLRLAQVTAIGTRDVIIQAKPTYDAVISAGIPDSEIVDGSVALARIYCCGGVTRELSSEELNARMVYIPRGLNVAPGDIVEVKVGNPPENGRPGSLNIVTRVVQKYGSDDANCWWDPKNDRLWLRVLYCSWMPSEGWVKQGGIDPAWFKPPTSDSGRK
jgi:hypothetical protein